MSRWLYALPALVFAALVAYFAAGLTRDPHLVPSALIGKPVPSFVLPPLPGSTVGLDSATLATGQPQLLTVFASWCAPCRAEQPVLRHLAEIGVSVRGLNYKDRPEDAVAWLSQYGNPFTSIGIDREGRVALDFGVYGVPETFVIDGQGYIRYKHIGPLMPDDLEQEIMPVIRQYEAR